MKKTFCDICEREIHDEKVTIYFSWRLKAKVRMTEQRSEDYHLECYLISANKNKLLRDLVAA